jgi:hypothetical protein
MPNIDYHHDETEPALLQSPVDVESAQDLCQPCDYADWLFDVRAVVIDAKQIQSEAEALEAEWSAAMDADAADRGAGLGEDGDWYEPPEYMTGEQDEESDGPLPCLEESGAILLEVNEIIVGALRVQEDAEAATADELAPDQAATQDELPQGASDVAVEATAPAESTDARNAELAALPGEIAGEIESLPEATGTDTKGTTPSTPKPLAKRADKRSSNARRSNKGSR